MKHNRKEIEKIDITIIGNMKLIYVWVCLQLAREQFSQNSSEN